MYFYKKATKFGLTYENIKETYRHHLRSAVFEIEARLSERIQN